MLDRDSSIDSSSCLYQVSSAAVSPSGREREFHPGRTYSSRPPKIEWCHHSGCHTGRADAFLFLSCVRFSIVVCPFWRGTSTAEWLPRFLLEFSCFSAMCSFAVDLCQLEACPRSRSSPRLFSALVVGAGTASYARPLRAALASRLYTLSSELCTLAWYPEASVGFRIASWSLWEAVGRRPQSIVVLLACLS